MKICFRCDARFSRADWKCPDCGAEPTSVEQFPSFAPELLHAGAAFEESFFDALAATEEQSFWFEGRTQLVLDVLSRYAEGARTMIDVGCGTGGLLQALQTRTSLRLTGAEPFVRGLHWARERSHDVELIQSDVLSLPYECEFDIAGAFDVIEHIEDDVAALRKIRRVIKPQGLLILTTPQHRWLWSEADAIAHHYRRYTRDELVRKLEIAGFKIRYATSFVSLLLPAMTLARHRSPRKTRAELNLPRSLNRILSSMMAFERVLIGSGVRFPAGGSLLVVAAPAPPPPLTSAR